MKQARRALATMIFAATVGCTGQLIPVQPTAVSIQTVSIYHSQDTKDFVDLLTLNQGETQQSLRLNFEEEHHQALLNRVTTDDIPFFISHHNPVDTELNLWSVPLAQDGIAIITHPNNPIQALSRQTLQSIYRGFTTNWSVLGGDDDDITLYTRQVDSGLRLEFNRLVMGQQQISPNAQVLATSQLMIEGILRDEQAIGYIPISLLQDSVRAIAIDDIMASITHIADNTYPYRMTIYAIGQSDLNPIQRALLINLQTLDYTSRMINYAPLFP